MSLSLKPVRTDASEYFYMPNGHLIPFDARVVKATK